MCKHKCVNVQELLKKNWKNFPKKVFGWGGEGIRFFFLYFAAAAEYLKKKKKKKKALWPANFLSKHLVLSSSCKE